MFRVLGWRIAVAGVIVVAALMATGSAVAVTPMKERLGVFAYEFSVDCGSYGFNFTIDTQGRESVFVETFYDANGEPVKIVVHSAFRETDTNSVTGPCRRHAHRRRQDVPDDGSRQRNRHSGRRASGVRCSVPRLVRSRAP